MNLILESPAPVRYFTDVGLMLEAAGIEVRDFDWHLSDVDTNGDMPIFNDGARWFTGDELADVLATERLQFIWAVFSAVPRGARSLVEDEPFAEGNGAFWESTEVKPQLPEALFEIVCWDSSAVLLIGLSALQAASFLSRFPGAKPLSESR